MPPMIMHHEVDPREELFKNVGDLSGVKVFNNQVLVAIYVRPTKTKGGIIMTDAYRDEDKIQGKVGLIVKLGSKAFIDPKKEWFGEGETCSVGDFVMFRPSDGWSVSINGAPCRMLDDINIRGQITSPDQVW